MTILLLAELLVLVHFAFILFVLFGGLLLLKWPRLAWLHLPAVIWGVVVEAMGWICPLTPLEIRFRLQAGQEGYSGDFLAHYLMPIIYPAGLNLEFQQVLAGFVIILNVVIYFFLFKKRGK